LIAFVIFKLLVNEYTTRASPTDGLLAPGALDGLALLVSFAIVESMVGLWNPMFTAIMAYTFFGLDALARRQSQ
jgi:hypothetical protein